MGWDRNVARMGEMRSTYKIVIRIKNPFARPKLRHKDKDPIGIQTVDPVVSAI